MERQTQMAVTPPGLDSQTSPAAGIISGTGTRTLRRKLLPDGPGFLRIFRSPQWKV